VGNEVVVNMLDGDENMQFGMKIDYENVDQPSKWELVLDPSNRPKQKAAKVRRVLTPPFYLLSVWVPAVKKDEHQEEYAGYLKLRKHPKEKNTLLDKLYTAEMLAKKAMGVSVEDLQFNPEEAWCYLVFCREEPKPVVRLAFYKTSIMKKIRTLQHNAHPTKPNILLNGPAICSDVLITKWYDPSEKIRMKRTSYEVEYMPDNRFACKIPTSFWERGFQFKPGEDFVTSGIFTKDEMEAIQTFLKDNDCSTLNEYMRGIVQPHTDDDVMKLLAENPLNPFANNKTGAVFPNPQRFIKELQALQVPCLMTAKEFKKVESGPPQESEKMQVPPPMEEAPLPVPPDERGKQQNPFQAEDVVVEQPATEQAGGPW
jgi:hypothetical protein